MSSSENGRLELLFDPARLTVIDPNPLNFSDNDKETEIKNLTQNAAVKLFNLLKTFEKVPSKDGSNTLIVMPKPVIKLPRQKHLPEEKKLTKWQLFAIKKGIKPKSRKPSIMFDEKKQDWVKRYGYRSATTVDENEIHELTEKQDRDGYDPFKDAKKRKADKIAKNEINQMKNLAKQHKLASSKKTGDLLMKSKLKIAKTKTSRLELKKEIEMAKKSTASIGKFQEKLKGEKDEKSAVNRRQFSSNLENLELEKEKMAKAVKFVVKKSKKIDINAASNNSIQLEKLRDKSLMKKRHSKR